MHSENDNDDAVPGPSAQAGPVDEAGRLHGRGTLTWEDGTVYRGRFAHGAKHGRGTLHFPDGSCMTASYIDDELDPTRQCLNYDVDGSSVELVGDLCHERDASGKLTAMGRMTDGVRVGRWHVFFPEGTSMEASLNAEGGAIGPDVVFYYPLSTMTMRGEWADDGTMKSAVFADAAASPRKKKAKEEEDGAEPRGRKRKRGASGGDEVYYAFDESTDQRISKTPLVRDPYETATVFVAQSRIAGGGEGLFAKVDLPAGLVCAFYNGIRLSHAVVDARDWCSNDNTITLDDETVLDVPGEMASTDVYCATLGHKVNHSFSPNSKYDVCLHHPRFGAIKCIRTIKPVAKGAEILVHYGYELGSLADPESATAPDAPAWYLESFSSAVSRTLL